MRALPIVDLAMYFLAGFMVALFFASMRREPSPAEGAADPEPPAYTRCGTLAMAAAVGLLLAGARYGAVQVAKGTAMRQLAETLEAPTQTVVVE